MTISEFEQEFMGHVPEIMGTKAHYAVLVPLVEGEEGLSLLYEVRARTLRSQPGEICFPGGRAEAGETPEECALREINEETGLTVTELDLEKLCHERQRMSSRRPSGLRKTIN